MNKSIEMFVLQESRPPLDNYNCYDHVDPEFGTICEPVSVTSKLLINPSD
jgi:hypothetical protein